MTLSIVFIGAGRSMGPEEVDKVLIRGRSNGEMHPAGSVAGISREHDVPFEPVAPGLGDQRMDLAGRVQPDQRHSSGEIVERRGGLPPLPV